MFCKSDKWHSNHHRNKMCNVLILRVSRNRLGGPGKNAPSQEDFYFNQIRIVRNSICIGKNRARDVCNLKKSNAIHIFMFRDFCKSDKQHWTWKSRHGFFPLYHFIICGIFKGMRKHYLKLELAEGTASFCQLLRHVFWHRKIQRDGWMAF